MTSLRSLPTLFLDMIIFDNMNINFSDIILLLLFFLILYPYAVYPAILFFFSKIFKKEVNKKVGLRKKISIILSCYNEEELIEDCIHSVFQSDYPSEDIELLVGSDGSTDKTAEIVKKLMPIYPQLKFFDLPRSGKNKVVNILAPQAEGEILFFLDADIRISKNSISLMLESFNDDDVGIVLSTIMSLEGKNDVNSGHFGEDKYRLFEKYLRKKEGSIFATMNGSGGFYSIRKSLFRALPNEYVCDDFTPLLYVSFEKKRIILEDRSLVYEIRGKTLKGEFSRRVRMAACSMSSVWNARKIFSFKTPLAAFFLFSHKVSRWYVPPFLLIASIISFLFYKEAIIPYISLYLIGITFLLIFVGWILEKLNIKCIIFRFAYVFFYMNLGMFFGVFKFLSKKQNSKWESIK